MGFGRVGKMGGVASLSVLAAVALLGAWEPAGRLCEILDKQINESSGVAASQRGAGVFYTHNDSGDTARFFRFNRRGEVTGVFGLKGVRAVDWEDMAVARVGGESWVYLADVGDNGRRREEIFIHRVREPDLEAGNSMIEDVETYTLTYPDGKHDCEAVMVRPGVGDIWLVTKARDGVTRVYVLPKPGGPGSYVLTSVGVLDIDTGGLGGRLVTGGDISPDGRRVALRTYTGAREYAAPSVFDRWLSAVPVVVPIAMERQGEAIGYTWDGSGLVTTSEGSPCPVNWSRRAR